MLDTASDLARDLMFSSWKTPKKPDLDGSRDVAVLLPDGSSVRITELVEFTGDPTLYLRVEE